MVDNHIVIQGTFRVGSTFLAKAFSAHQNLSVASDPYFYFFKALRNEICLREGVENFDIDSPISDNFYSNYWRINKKIRGYDLNIPIKFNTTQSIVENISRLAGNHSPLLVPYLREIRAESYAELYRKLVRLVRVAYGDENTKICGYKVIFAEQFLQPLLNTFPEMKCIYLVRDPRAVLASQNAFYENEKNKLKYADRGRYPLLYVIRNWRKSIAYLIDNAYNEKNIIVVQYEKLVSNPEHWFRKICDFLDVSYDANMADASRYKGGDGSRWSRNSSYDTSAEITTKSIPKWKDVLNHEEVRMVEDLCSTEMEIFGYDRVTKPDIMEALFNVQVEPIEKIDPWIRKYVNHYTLNEREAEKELMRWSLLNFEVDERKVGSDYMEKVLIGHDFIKKMNRLRSAQHS